VTADPSGASAQVDPERLGREVERLADRLRTLSDVRLARALPPYASRADAARAVVQLLADGAAGLEGRPVREVPRLPDLAVGDQVAVTGTDLVVAAAASWPAEPAVAALTVAVNACRELRLAL
jgi:hypothetical protein